MSCFVKATPLSIFTCSSTETFRWRFVLPVVGCQQILTLGPGELLGWSSMLEQLRYTARARTRSLQLD